MNHVPVPQKLRDHVDGSDASVSLKDIQLVDNCTPSYYLMYSIRDVSAHSSAPPAVDSAGSPGTNKVPSLVHSLPKASIHDRLGNTRIPADIDGPARTNVTRTGFRSQPGLYLGVSVRVA